MKKTFQPVVLVPEEALGKLVELGLGIGLVPVIVVSGAIVIPLDIELG